MCLYQWLDVCFQWSPLSWVRIRTPSAALSTSPSTGPSCFRTLVESARGRRMGAESELSSTSLSVRAGR
jgi:hypothetical protein